MDFERDYNSWKWHHEMITDHEKRIRMIEKTQWKMTAILSAFTALAAAVGSIIGKVIL